MSTGPPSDADRAALIAEAKALGCDFVAFPPDAAIEPPSDADPGPMSDEEWEPFAQATGIEPPSESACECCGEDRPWTMVVDPTGHAVALCAECIDMLTPQWTPWVGTEPFDA